MRGDVSSSASGLFQLVREEAIRAGAIGYELVVALGRIGFFAFVDKKSVSALLAHDFAMIAEQRCRHRPGGDDERFRKERLEDKHQHDDEDDGLDQFAKAVVMNTCFGRRLGNRFWRGGSFFKG